LYWNFLIENEDKLAGNQRMMMPYRTLRGMGEHRRIEIQQDAARFLGSLRAEPDPDHQGDQTANAT
jgi:deoxyribodipyrimidine photolyase-related protein